MAAAKSTNYVNAFIMASADSDVIVGRVPSKHGTVAAVQYSLLAAAPYQLTSDDLLLEVHAQRRGIAPGDRSAALSAFFAEPQACLRCSPLVKTYGWGLHCDARGRLALYGVESAAYRELAARDDLDKVPGMRSRRG